MIYERYIYLKRKFGEDVAELYLRLTIDYWFQEDKEIINLIKFRI